MEQSAEWARCAGYILDALEYADGTHTLEDVRLGVEDGRFQFWPGPHSAIVTEIVQFPQLRALHLFLAGGIMAELAAMLPVVLEWAKRKGCTRATLSGRPGWARSFQRERLVNTRDSDGSRAMSKKGGGAQTVRTELDPMTKDYMRGTDGAYNAASAQPYSPYQGQTVAGVSPLAPEATERTRAAANFGMGGMEEMYKLAKGDYGALTPAFKQAQEQAIMAANDQATRAGAFGGSRHGQSGFVEANEPCPGGTGSRSPAGSPRRSARRRGRAG